MDGTEGALREALEVIPNLCTMLDGAGRWLKPDTLRDP